MVLEVDIYIWEIGFVYARSFLYWKRGYVNGDERHDLEKEK